MTNQIHTQNQHTEKETQDSSNTTVQGMFKARPFVVQSKSDHQLQQPNLNTSLIQAQKYGHHLSKINSANQSVPTPVQAKPNVESPVQFAKRKNPPSSNQTNQQPPSKKPKTNSTANSTTTSNQPNTATTSNQPNTATTSNQPNKNSTANSTTTSNQPNTATTSNQPNTATTSNQPNTNSKGKKRRDTALGKTPGKTSVTGRKVLERWHANGKAQWIGPQGTTPNYKQQKDSSGNPLWQVSVKGKGATTRTWMPLDQNIHMGHKLGAVDYWQKGAANHIAKKPKYQARYGRYRQPGYQAAPRFKSAIHRNFMMNPANYRFEYGPANSSAGAKTGNTLNYTSLPSGEAKW